MKLKLKVENVEKDVTKVVTQISQKDVDTLENEILNELSSDVEIDGFKKGDAPDYIVRMSLRDDIALKRNEVIFSNIGEELLKKEKIDINTMEFIPEYDKIEENGDTFNVEFAVAASSLPTVSMTDYQKLVPNFIVPRVSQKDIARELTRAIKSVVTPKKIDREKLEKWDIAVLDIKTTIEKNEPTEAKDVMVEIGSNFSVPGFEEGLIGMKIGGKKSLKLSFPEDYPNISLAGLPVKYDVVLKEIRIIKMPKSITAATLKKLLPNDEKPSVEILEDRISRSLFFRQLDTEVNKSKVDFLQKVIDESKFSFNDSFLEEEFDKTYATISDEEKIKIEKDKKSFDEYKKNVKLNVESWYKYRLVLQNLFASEEITLSDEELEGAFSDYVARLTPEAAEKSDELKDDAGFMQSLRDSTMETKLFYKLFKITQ